MRRRYSGDLHASTASSCTSSATPERRPRGRPRRCAVPMPPSRRQRNGRAVLERARSSMSPICSRIRATARARGAGRGFRSVLAVPMLREATPIGVIGVGRGRAGPFTDSQIELLQDLRRPGRHRHRERPAVQGARGADAGPDAVGRRAQGARRGQPGRQLHARPRDRARDDRQPRGPALRQRRRDRLRVRGGLAELSLAGHAPRLVGAPGGRAVGADPARRGRGRAGRREPGAGAGRRHPGGVAAHPRPRPGASTSGRARARSSPCRSSARASCSAASSSCDASWPPSPPRWSRPSRPSRPSRSWPSTTPGSSGRSSAGSSTPTRSSRRARWRS